MKLLFYILPLFACVTNCNSQKNIAGNSKSADKFLRWILEERAEVIISNKPVHLEINLLQGLADEIKFSKKDSIAISDQIAMNNKAVFNSDLTAKKTFLSDTELKKETDKSTYLYLKVSRPVFFSDKVFIFIEQYCGDLCGHGEIQVYSINKGDHKFLFKKQIWIS
jgi:hypothetical protein